MRILIVDDEARFAQLLRQHLQADGYPDVEVALSADEAIDLARQEAYHLVITDLRLRGQSGLELLAELKRTQPGTAVVLMTAFAGVDTARAALTRGALDYLTKPFDLAELSRLVARLSVTIPEDTSRSETPFCGMIGTTPAMRRLFADLVRAAESDATVLITGESGTGKELVARAIHDLSARHRGTFVDLNCAAIAESLVESELFGHEQGAFTGADRQRAGRIENAAGGTLFLDELGEMPLTLQPKLLRFLQERRFWRVGGNKPILADVRIVAATNRDLRAEVQAKRFREDLFYRLEVVTLHLPPLAERRADIAPLVRHILRRKGLAPTAISADALEHLETAAWPGNVRQLANAVERALVRSGGAPITIDHLDVQGEATGTVAAAGSSDHGPLPGLYDNERHLIERVLQQAAGNKTRAAELLGITRRRLYSRLKSLGMTADDDGACSDEDCTKRDG